MRMGALGVPALASVPQTIVAAVGHFHVLVAVCRGEDGSASEKHAKQKEREREGKGEGVREGGEGGGSIEAASAGYCFTAFGKGVGEP